jgi:hypothetical protein
MHNGVIAETVSAINPHSASKKSFKTGKKHLTRPQE